jgi:hypothetical protein
VRSLDFGYKTRINQGGRPSKKEGMMPRYIKGQRVQVVTAMNSEGKPKYREVEAHVGKFGVILEYYRIGYEAENALSDYHVYEIRLDGDNSIMAIPEDVLKPLIA